MRKLLWLLSSVFLLLALITGCNQSESNTQPKSSNSSNDLQDQKKDVVILNYTVDLVLLDEEGKESKRIPFNSFSCEWEMACTG